ncbi:hypothetical protein [Croceicoccus mobilis]|uniref:Tetratricopeptide repeat protein n=1 Tax=Croceicoccus mobilis TaxID=1703339 RepID=A0A916YS60_9SPHN|nr:hypothetical protein [Croceicoccus mobilis]GGD57928.1 hypothetical protein GCM10010990_04010 [Croceicoccus mobilis]
MDRHVFISASLLAISLAGPAHAQDATTSGGHSETAVSAASDDESAGASAGAGHDTAEHDLAAPPAILENYGNGGFPITTSVPEAQAYFDNGIALAGAFAHKQAIEAMAEAVRLDPACAMCLWGHAYTLGPTLNYGVDEEKRAEPRALLKKAAMLARANGSQFERDLIAAITPRYRSGDTDKSDKAYDKAMRSFAAKYPASDMAQVLAADASMLALDWPDFAGLEYAIGLLEPVLARNPDHTPAIHFYIHATEIHGTPEKAEVAADRLDAMELSASHLVHMPSHTWYWVGRYQDAANANVRAVGLGQHEVAHMGDKAADEVWTVPYHAHNVIFGLGGALMAGDSRSALMLARPLVAMVEKAEDMHPIRQLLTAAGYFALARFEDPNVVLALEEPKPDYSKAAWHYARGEAFAFLGNTAGVKSEAEAIPVSINTIDGKSSPAPEHMLSISRLVLQGRAAMMAGEYRNAAARFAEAAAIEETEDFSRFSDPPAFWYPVRRDLASALLKAGDRDAALR